MFGYPRHLLDVNVHAARQANTKSVNAAWEGEMDRDKTSWLLKDVSCRGAEGIVAPNTAQERQHFSWTLKWDASESGTKMLALLNEKNQR